MMYYEDLSNEGMGVTPTMLATELFSYEWGRDADFGENTTTFRAILARVYRWMKRHGIVHRRVTSMQNKGYNEAICNSFHEQVNKYIVDEGIPIDCIVNIDETSVYYDMTATVTLARRGTGHVVL
jgi:hypothetical protein